MGIKKVYANRRINEGYRTSKIYRRPCSKRCATRKMCIARSLTVWLKIDSEKALRMPGVEMVITCFDVPNNFSQLLGIRCHWIRIMPILR